MVDSQDIATIVVPVAILLVYAYSAYWALSIRRALAVRLYRNQALGIGLVAVSLSTGLVVSFEIPIDDFFIVPLLVAFTVIFYWIDTSMLAARRSDPLLRDPLRWRQLRILFWTLIIIPLTVVFAVLLYIHILPGSVSYLLELFPPLIGNIIASIPFAVTAFSGAVFLPFVARRSKDMGLGKHLKWFGAFALVFGFLFLLSPLTNNDPFLGPASLFVGVLIAGYCLYRSARSLAPLNRLSIQEFGQPSPKDTPRR